MYFLPTAADVSKCPSSAGNAPTPLLAGGEISLARKWPNKVTAMLAAAAAAANVLLAWRVEVAITGAFINKGGEKKNNT